MKKQTPKSWKTPKEPTKKLPMKKAKPSHTPRVVGVSITKGDFRTAPPTVPALQSEAGLSLMKVDDVMRFAQTLKAYIVANKLSVEIEGNQYAKVDAWKFAGLNFGLTGIPQPPVAMHKEGQSIVVQYAKVEHEKRNGEKYWKELPVLMAFLDNTEALEYMKTSGIKVTREIHRPYFAYKCGCDVVKISDGTRVSFGEGMCSNLEETKVMNAEYAINSQAQTRAIGKALKNLLGFVMSNAGFAETPAEEMDEMKKQREHAPEYDSSPKLPPLTEAQEEGTIENIRNGKWSIEQVLSHCTLTDRQLKALVLAEEKAKEQKKGIWNI